MRKQGGGHLIYISSISGLMPDVSGAAYQAGKRGLLGLAHAIRVEEKEHGIRTCVICPGLVETEILEKRPVKPTADVLAKALQPEDVAERRSVHRQTAPASSSSRSPAPTHLSLDRCGAGTRACRPDTHVRRKYLQSRSRAACANVLS